MGDKSWVQLSGEESRAVECYYSEYNMPEIMNIAHSKQSLKTIVKWYKGRGKGDPKREGANDGQ